MSVQANGTATSAEVCEGCLPTLIALQNRNVGLEETIRRQASALGAARRKLDPEVRAKEHARWQEVQELFDYWRRHCRHPRSRFSAKRFGQALPYVEAHGVELCKRAIDGAAYDPFTTKRRNGSTKRYDDWSLIFRDDDKFEESVNKAPRRSECASVPAGKESSRRSGSSASQPRPSTAPSA